MSYKFLKWTRVVIALVFFLSISLVFLDFRDIVGVKGVQTITFLQFVPSILKFLTVLSLSAVGFLIVIVLTALFGRVYCSTICPLGVLQDFISRFSLRFKRKKRYKFKKPHNILRNSILILTILSALFLTIFFVNILDPYSSFGKIANQLFRPLGVWINNGIASVLENMNIYYLYRMDLNPVHFSSFAIALVILVVLFIMAGKYGRLYCNTICPVGTLLGWLSKFSLFKVRLNKSACTQCGKCSFACKSECISVKDMEVDHSRCVACFNCLT
ncbi:MAG: 4Fe-4S binding protein, partial [Bacteroidales bacterium]